ncbi:FISUMP domain-containing protein [Dysgonomonas sp. BGC7]|uniref:FISUMP domain-containing protein n=1 Tax=Dysgonomonas sp. BGC7 TaxID=1658008 RepID=UPI0009E554EA|nr:FISUMP domain-containing protein [Dysgonomonas sp. BGC7]MBD8388333.1 fibrobacter succinogenes major paralogous domain-containing protein [Dysgonomonas sp. BGC7]
MKLHLLFLLILCIFFFLFAIPTFSYSQVTIGSNIPPTSGALLDLKEGSSLVDNSNSKRGLLLPRVNLSSLNNLYPMFEELGTEGTPVQEYDTEAKKNNQDVWHKGLIVFNMNECAPFGKGVYIWTGEDWRGINTSLPIATPSASLQSLPNVLHIPSGTDKRAFAPVVASFGFTSSDKATWSGPISGIGGGLSQLQIVPDNPKEWDSGSAELSVTANAFTSGEILSIPWKTKESSITIYLPANSCGSGSFKEVKLNQTNYIIDIKDKKNQYPVSLITIKEGDVSKTLTVNSNSLWQAKASVTEGSLSNILTSYTQTENGAVLSNNEKVSSPFLLLGAEGSPGNRYKYATIKFADPDNKALDVEVRVVQCQGSQDASKITETATPDVTSGANIWGTKVVRHLAKNGVYNEFVSADFGDAGRWMTTNLGAKQYDSNISSAALGNPTYIKSYYNPYWAYPNVDGGDPTSPLYYNTNPDMGFLYNFAAATATVKNNIHTDERGLASSPIQGICPNGWHLPSDREWTMLENEIIKNTTKYALVSKDIYTKPTDLLSYFFTEGYRGHHGAAMVNTCEEFVDGAQGVSRRLDEGGFNILFCGYVVNEVISEQRQAGVYWTSSSANAEPYSAYDRVFYNDDPGIANYGYGRNAYLSVRCKKN